MFSMVNARAISPANSRDSRKAAANRGCRLLSTGSSGRIKSSGSFSQVIIVDFVGLQYY